MEKKYIQILRKLRPGKFKPLPRVSRLDCIENLQQMRDNLWSMFKLKYTKKQLEEFHKTQKWPFGASVADYAWTDEAKQAFYDHPYHRQLVNRLKKRKDLTWGLWVLNTEPSDYPVTEPAPVPRQKKSKMNSLMSTIGKSLSEGEIEAIWDFDNEQPVRPQDESLPRFVVGYINSMLTQGEGVTLEEMKKDAAGLLRSIQEDLFNIEQKLKA